MFFPLGFVLWCRIWRFRFRLLRDMKQITETCERLSPLLRHVNADGMIEGTALSDEEGGESASGASAGKAGWRRRWSVRRVGALLVALVIVFLAGWYAQRYLRKYFRAKAHTEQRAASPAENTSPSGSDAALPKTRNLMFDNGASERLQESR